jgi:hypothetical protein
MDMQFDCGGQWVMRTDCTLRTRNSEKNTPKVM